MKSTVLAFLIVTSATPAIALPPPEDQPEEVARTEIITEARSPVDNKPLTAAEYTVLQEQLQQGQPENPRNQVSPQLRRTIGLLRLRRLIRTVFPFIPLR
jgi:hypothetical protein